MEPVTPPQASVPQAFSADPDGVVGPVATVGYVVIGRDEGDRLRRCLDALPVNAPVVYVDSGSTDASVGMSRARGIEVVELDLSKPFTAARARNVGAARVLALHPGLTAIQFVDGDCELASGWVEAAARELDARRDVAIVCGRLRERNRSASVYNRLCDMEWDTPVGDVTECGGIALIRTGPFRDVGGFRAELAAGEEPDLCARFRSAKWKVVRLPNDMALHDAAMTRFGQWWRRTVRAGMAYAEVSDRHGRTGLRPWRRQVLSNWFWAAGVPLVAVGLSFLNPWLGLFALGGYAILAARIYRNRRRRGDTPADARLYAAFNTLAKFPMALGQARYRVRRLFDPMPTPSPTLRSDSAATLRVGYLVNQYPHVSHSFIRREIAGVEAAGISVFRFTVRRPNVELVDPQDRKEAEETRVLLDTGPVRLAVAVAVAVVTRPVRMMRAARRAWRLGGRSGRRLRPFVYLAEACLLRRWLVRDRVQHLHAHFGTNSTDVALLCRELGGPPYSFTVHGPEEFDRPEALSLGDKIAAAAFVVAISSFGRSQLFRWSRPEDWAKIRVIRCGVDAAFLQDGPLPVAAGDRLVCVGRLAEQKGQLLLIEAAARLARLGVGFELVLAGDGPMRPVIEAAIAGHQLRSRVRITGWLSNDAVRAEIAASRVVVLPSFAEGLPVVLMEALALGRPVVTTYVAGIPELVRDGETGWLVPAGDVTALTDALKEALTASVDRLAEMGRAGAAAVRAAHDALGEAAKLVSCIDEFRKSPLSEGGRS